MKNKYLVILFSIFLTINVTAQRPIGGGGTMPTFTEKQFHGYFFPDIFRTTTMITCSTILPQINCNYIRNNQFNTNVFPYDNTDPFGLDQVVDWSNSHGQPRLANPFFGIGVPPTANNFVMLAFGSSSSNSNFGSGIVQNIPATQAGNNYLFRFFELNPIFGLSIPLDEVNIYLIKCADYQNFNVNQYSQPVIPINSQRIFCETNLNTTSFSSSDWLNRVLKFTANDAYDMIWITPKPKSSGLFHSSIYCFALPELINVNSFSINNITTDCIASLTPSCNVYGAIYNWVGPNGQIFTGDNINVDLNLASNAGTWTVTLTTPSENLSNSLCGNANFSVSASVNLVKCSGCINLPLVQ